MRDERFVALLLLILILFACRPQQRATGSADNSNDAWRKDTVIISFERTACFGKCPTFKVDFFGNGNVSYHGINNVENKGHFVGEIDIGQLEAMYKKADAIGFFQMEDKYDGNITDIPSQIYFMAMYGKRKKIYSRYKMPPALNEFGTFIDVVIQGIEWNAGEDPDH